MITLGTKTSIGEVVSVKTGNPRDYLLIDTDGSVTWLDELALQGIINKEQPKPQEG